MLFGRRRTLRERICNDQDAMAAALFADAFCAVAAVDTAGGILRANARLHAFVGSADQHAAGCRGGCTVRHWYA